jgi:1,6-anhydro-N-acetylmuramate kinase
MSNLRLRALGLMSGTSMDGIDVASDRAPTAVAGGAGPVDVRAYEAEFRRARVQALADATVHRRPRRAPGGPWPSRARSDDSAHAARRRAFRRRTGIAGSSSRGRLSWPDRAAPIPRSRSDRTARRWALLARALTPAGRLRHAGQRRGGGRAGRAAGASLPSGVGARPAGFAGRWRLLCQYRRRCQRDLDRSGRRAA